MTLQEKLATKRRIAQRMKPLNSAKEIWKYILLEFNSMTANELLMGRRVCIDIEKKGGKSLVLKRYILDGKHNEYNLTEARILLDVDCASNLDDIMNEVSEQAKQESCRTKTIKDENYQVWTFEILLIPVKE